MPRELPAKFVTIALAALLIGNVFAVRALLSGRPALSVFAAGKGRAALLEYAGGRLLLDAGSDASVLRGLGTRLPPWTRRLDAVFLTTDKGNGGLAAVKERYKIGRVLRFGTDVPYGSRLSLPEAALVIEAPGRYRLGGLSISSSTPVGTYNTW